MHLHALLHLHGHLPEFEAVQRLLDLRAGWSNVHDDACPAVVGKTALEDFGEHAVSVGDVARGLLRQDVDYLREVEEAVVDVDTLF